MTTAKLNVTSATLPAGDYWVGDPCYAIEYQADWMDWLEAAKYETENVLLADHQGKAAVGIGTAYGDGVYRGSDGNDYPVDAGLIGAVPAEVVTGTPSGMNLVTFAADFDASRDDNGTITIGHIRIATGDED